MSRATLAIAAARIESRSLVLTAPLEVRGDEGSEVAVEDGLHIARLVAGALVLDELIRSQRVRADLTPERDVALLARHLLDRLAPLLALTRREARGEDLHGLGPVLQ